MVWANPCFLEMGWKKQQENTLVSWKKLKQKGQMKVRQAGSFVSQTYRRTGTTSKQRKMVHMDILEQMCREWKCHETTANTTANKKGSERHQPLNRPRLGLLPPSSTRVQTLASLCGDMKLTAIKWVRLENLRQNCIQIRKEFWHGLLIQVLNFLNETYGFEQFFTLY